MTGSRGPGRSTISWVLAISMAAAITGVLIPVTASAACEPGPAADISLSLSISQAQNGDTMYSLVVTNFGPSCAQGVRIHIDLPTGSGFVNFSSPDNWSCSSAPGSPTVDCGLQTDLSPQASSSITVEATPPANTPKGAAHVTASANGTTDPDPSDNQGWIALSTEASTGPPGPNEQATYVSRPNADSISVNQVLPTSKLAAGVPPPCGPRCVAGREVIFATLPTDPSKFPDVHLAIVLNLPTKQTRNTLPVYRFDHESNKWLGPLPNCVGGGPVDPNVGCVKSVVMGSGFITVTVWTAHNGHIRG